MEDKNVDDQTKMFLVISTGLMLACFTSKAYDVYNDYQTLSEKKCDQNYLVDKNNKLIESNSECIDKKNKEIEEYVNNKTNTMLIIGFIYLVMGVLISKNSSSSLIGISLGGFFLIIYYLVTNWFKFSQKNQVMIMGGILAGMIFAGSNSNYKQLLM